MFTVWRPLLLPVILYLCSPVTKTEEKITINGKIAVKDEGSCVTINCTYVAKENMHLLWFKDPEWDDKNIRFKGIIVHSNVKERPPLPEYSSRVKFPGDSETSKLPKRTSCTLKINNLQMNDSGNYSFRYIGEEKYMSEAMKLTVKANPCKVHLSPLEKRSFIEGEPVTLQCTTSAECPDYPEWLMLNPSGTSREEEKYTNMEKVNKLQLNVTWKDHGRTLSCRPANSMDDCQTRNITLTVEYAPKETKIKPSPTDVKEGESVTLLCSTNAHPNASFTWFKNEVSLNHHSSEYKLDRVKSEDSGSYRCEASNSLGNDSSPVVVDVKYAPKGVNVTAESNEVKEGDELKLTCKVLKSNPDQSISYSWYQNDQQLMENSNQLIFPSIKRSEDGQYRCQASNDIGSTKSNPTVISVKYAPERTKITGAQKIKLDFALNLHCETFADPLPYVYFWYHKSEVGQKYVFLSNTTKSEYQTEKVALSDSGWYLCSPRNTVGTGQNSTEFQVHVLYPPRKLILHMPTNVTEAEKLTINCTVESYPEAKITLSRTHTNSQEVVAERDQSNTLTFCSVASRSHAGSYTCTAENSEGKNFTEQRLKVFYAPKDVQASVSSEKHNKGSSLNLTCIAHSEPSVTQYTWKKWSETPEETVGEGPHLTLHSLKKSDSGNYFCTASNDIGTNTSASVLIKVQYRPNVKIIHNLTSLDEWDGRSPVQLTCSADCYPAASHYEWHKQDHDDVTFMSKNQNYTVQPLKPGIYYCTAGNDIGTTTSDSISLFVNQFVRQMLLLLIPVVFILLIGFLFLLYRTILRKRSSDGADSQLFFYEGPSNNTRENLVMVGVMEPSSTTTAPPNSSTSRDNMSGRLAADTQTVYDLVKLPQIKQDGHPHTEEDSVMTSVNYANLPVKGWNDPTASDRSTDGAVYAVVSKNKKNKTVAPSGNEDYENVSGACAPKLDFSKIIWESDSSEEEEEVNYSKVTFTPKQQHKPTRAGGDSTSDEEDKIEYSHVKI